MIPLTPEIRRMISHYCDKKMAGLTVCKANYMDLAGETHSQYNEVMKRLFENLYFKLLK